MGLEVGDGSGEPMADEVRAEDPVEALRASCESLDLGDKATEEEEEKEAVGADSNGHLTEEGGEEEGESAAAAAAARRGLDDAAAPAPIESVPEVSKREEVPESSRSQGQIKNWSDFNAVSAHTFGDQSFGSFSDFLANQPDLSPEAPSQAPGQALELGSDIDFFEWGVTAAEPVGTGGMGVMAPPPTGLAQALPQRDEQPLETGSTIVAQEEPAPSPVSTDEFFGSGHETTAEVPPEQTLVSDEAAAAAAQSADPYPGWYYDYDVGEWRAVEGYNALSAAAGSENAGYSGDYVDSGHMHHMQTIAETSAFQQEVSPISAGVPAPGVGLEQQPQSWDSQSSAGVPLPAVGLEQQPQSWDSQSSAATHTVADEYPGWKWDYSTQTWVAAPGDSEPWQSTSTETQFQGGGAEQSWYAPQEQQTQPYNSAASFADQPVASSPQPQSFMSGHGTDNANVMANGYSSQPANAGSIYTQKTSQQWHREVMPNNAAAGQASNFYSPQMNGDRSWPAPAFNQPEQFSSQSMPSVSYPSPDAYYNYAANGGPHNYTQQAWGHAPQFNQYPQFTNPNAPPPKNVQEALRTCSGRPPHSLAAFGFGGKFIFMKHRDPVTLHTSNGDQAFASGEAWMPGPIQVSNLKSHISHESTFAGPLNGGGVSTKELIKWIDERASSQPTNLRLLLGVLKVACQHYGKLRSANVNSGNSAVEEDGPEAALAKLLAGAVVEQNPYAGLTLKNFSLRGVPSEQLLQATALEVKRLLVCGKRKDALKCAQEGELWSIALVVARQLGEKYFCDTVTEMARRQFVSGSPLRTLSLLFAGQPAEVFATPSLQSGNPMEGVAAASDQSQDGHEAMLDDWQENLAIMAANRTQGDERVMSYLGHRLSIVRGEVAAAHLCYLVADANLESYSENARLCLIGADHCKFPRTFVTPEAIQRTEIYEYARVLGNPQSILISFQPYKLVYAEMLVECGKTAEALRYCQIVLKTLKAAGMRDPQVEACRILATNMEERLRVHMQDGHGSKLAPGKLVKGLFGTLDWGIHRIIGGPPPPAPPADPFGYRPLDTGDHFGSQNSRPGNSTALRSGSSLVPSNSIATSMERLPPEPNRGPSRSQSEPDFGRNAKQGETEVNSGVSPRAAGLRLGMVGRLGSTFLQKATGLWGSSKKEAKLGDANKFYYDEKLKKWVEEGVDPTPDIAPPPPPPTTSSFMGTPSPQEETQAPPQAVTLKPGTPPLAPNSINHYSNRRQSGVRSRYVDTFNKGGSTAPGKSVMGSLIPSPMPSGVGMMSSPAMFVPSPVPSTSFNESNNSDVGDNFLGGGASSRNGDASTSLGPLSDTANSHPNMDSGGLGYPSSARPMIPQLSTAAENALASFNAESTGLSSHGEPPPMFGVAHARSSSWSGYPSSFQNPLVPGEEDGGFGASFSGHDRRTGSGDMAMSVAQSSYTNFYLPNGSGSGVVNTSVPTALPSVVPSAAAGDIRDPSRQQTMGQPFRGSQSVDSLTGEEMQEVEL